MNELIVAQFISSSLHDEWHSMFVIYNEAAVSLTGDAFKSHKNWHAHPAFHSACLMSLPNEGKHWYSSIKKVYIEPRCSWGLVLVVSQPFITAVDVLGYYLFHHVFLTGFFFHSIWIQNVHSCKKTRPFLLCSFKDAVGESRLVVWVVQRERAEENSIDKCVISRTCDLQARSIIQNNQGRITLIGQK